MIWPVRLQCVSSQLPCLVDAASNLATPAAPKNMPSMLHYATALLIANAGFVAPAGFKDLSFEQYQGMIQVAQHGAFVTLREGVRHMVSRVEAGGPPGSLIATGSLSNFQAVPGSAHYAAAKCAVAAMIKNIAVEYGGLGIRANMLCAGLIASETVPADLPMIVELGERAPIGRVGTSDDLAGAVVYLMSDASRFHTGDLITIDGGAMAGLYH